MKKLIVLIAILFISMWGISEINAALSTTGIGTRALPECARATEECPLRPGHYMVVCKDGGAGLACTYACPYVLDARDCEDVE